MSPPNEYESSGENDDDENVFDHDIEALRRACMLPGTNPNNLPTSKPDSGSDSDSDSDLELVRKIKNQFSISSNNPNNLPTSTTNSIPYSDSDSEGDLELVRKIKNQFSISSVVSEPLSLKPLCTLPPATSGDDDDDDDDFETLRAIQRRFSSHSSDTVKHDARDSLKKPEQVHASSLSLEKESTDNFFVNRTNAYQGFPDSEEFSLLGENVERQPSGFIESDPQSDACNSSMLPFKSSSFPKSALLLIDAIKKNRSSQKFLRSKLIHIEARMEENKKLKERVKIFKGFQVSCKKRTGRALSQKKDPRVELISVKRLPASKDLKVNDKWASAMSYGPEENSHVRNYRMALKKFPLSFDRKKWSKAERENLGKGIRQQFQEMMLQISVDQFSGSEGSSGDSNDFDNIVASIKDLEITPEKIREFLPKVNWEQLASMYVVGRSGAECEARWLNVEDPLINHNPWTVEEYKHLLLLVQENGINNWFRIAVSLGTSRTPFQCLACYQRRLNPSILKREWTKEDDAQLHSAVEAFGESNWQSVASALEGRTGTQCSNRWKKTLHPTRKREGKWLEDEDKRLNVAVMLFGPKNWNKIAEFVPGRTQVQCRERWVNVLKPSLNLGGWTADEDSRLKAAIITHKYCWAKVAACMAPRTDSQCRRRWKVLFPHEVPFVQEARRIQKAVLPCNFVDRESERPALCRNDFLPLPMISSLSESKNKIPSKRKGRLSGKPKSNKEKNDTSCNIVLKKIGSKKCVQQSQACSGTTNKYPKLHPRRKKLIEPMKDSQSLLLVSESLESVTTNGDCIEATSGSSSTSNKEGTKHYSRGNIYTTESRGNQNSSWSSGKSMLSGTTYHTEHQHDRQSCQDSTLLSITNGEENDTLDRHDSTRKKRAPKLRLKRKKCMELAEDSHCFSSPPETLEFRIDDGEGVGRSFLDNENRALKLQDTKKKSNQPSGKCQDDSVPCQGDSRKLSKHANISSKHILGTIDDGEDITLAQMRNKSKKRRLEVATNANQACSLSGVEKGTELLPNSIDKLRDENRIVSVMQDGESQRCCNAGITEKLSPCTQQSSHLEDMLTVMASDSGPGQNVALQELVSINPEGDHEEAGDITLACLMLQNKFKKRRFQATKTANQSRSSSSFKKGSTSSPKGANKRHDESQNLSVMQDKESQTCRDIVTPENLSPCGLQSSCSECMLANMASENELGKLDLVKGQNVVLHNEADDITLACLMHNRRKKRRFQAAQSGIPVCSSSHMEKVSE